MQVPRAQSYSYVLPAAYLSMSTMMSIVLQLYLVPDQEAVEADLEH